jgi:peptidyl-prolyl cis-trans isomerase A (cyclophilin A)
MKRVFAVLFSAGLAAGAAAQDNPKAILHTSDGDITIELLPQKAPKTVENFIGLSTGQKTWTDPKSGKVVNGQPLYNGTIFHRTIPGFMIQGGDPMGNGMGGPGFRFANEDSDEKFDQPGVVAMANAGRDTNGSQFFITVAPYPSLNGGYTIFGKVSSGMDIVNKIVNKPTGPQDRPKEPTVIKSIEIIQPGAAAATPAADAASTASADNQTTR